MKLVTVVGIILVGLGTLLLAYFASPVRLLFQATLEHHKIVSDRATHLLAG